MTMNVKIMRARSDFRVSDFILTAMVPMSDGHNSMELYRKSCPPHSEIAYSNSLTNLYHKDFLYYNACINPDTKLFIYWPFIGSDFIGQFSKFKSCVAAQGLNTKKQHKTKLLPPNVPVKDITIDVLEPLPKTRNGNQYISVITDIYSKLKLSIPMGKTTTPYMAAVLINHWIIPYGIPNIILSNNCSKFMAEFFKTICYILGVKQKMKISYHSQTNGNPKYITIL